MFLAIDAPSPRSAGAAVLGDHPGDQGGAQLSRPSRNTRATTTPLPEMVEGRKLPAVAVATGPGSFTGLRVGVSFGLGLAIGLKTPIVPLPTLAIQAARAENPVIAVSEAGRGRVYHLAPGGEPGLAEPGELPKEWQAVGWLRPATQQALIAAGVRMLDESRLRSFGAAGSIVLKTAKEEAYDSLRLEYMQSFASKF